MGPFNKDFPNIPERLSGLVELAYNLWWSWHPEARMLFKLLNRPAWKESVHNPIKMLRGLPPKDLERASKDTDYLRHYDSVMARFNEYVGTKAGWFSENICDPERHPVAYFSPEYGLHHSLPLYAGGLGFLAGDYLKECSDLGVPMVAVGFMYPEGYLKQKVRSDGWQENVDEVLDRTAAPIARALDGNDTPLVVKVPFIEPTVYVAVWKVSVGRVSLYLLDTDIEQNDPWNRTISYHLYIGDLEQRLRQEIVLGIGGSEVLRTLGIRHSVFHLNEGHAAFALLERIRERIEDGLGYHDALKEVMATSVFTTHTPVPAGHDVFPFGLMDKYFSRYYPILGISRDEFHGLGSNPSDPGPGFNMTALALRLAEFKNGVSKRHGEVSRKMWQALWPDMKLEEVPIAFVTNGVHVPTWIEPRMQLLLNEHLGEEWLERHDEPGTWDPIDDVPDTDLWKTHVWIKMKLAESIHRRARDRWIEDRVAPANVVAGGALLDPLALTIGFARRFATYKRADLIFSDRERLIRLLNDPLRPLQIIFAGKAHPADDQGKRILQRIFNIAHDPSFGGRIAFVENYDEQLAQYMVHGVDVWLNNPVPPMEACGTSGMKAALNGVPQLSILDGWWIEGYNGGNGWAFEPCEGSDRDAGDAAAIYDLLENSIVPLYYETDEEGVPRGWMRVMKEAMKTAGPAFSARRMAKEYCARFYQKSFAVA